MKNLLISLTLLFISSAVSSQKIFPDKLFFPGGRIVTQGTFFSGDRDTIYSFIGSEPIYRLILNRGELEVLNVAYPMSMRFSMRKGKILSITLEDTLETSGFKGLVVKFWFYKNGRISNGGSSFDNNLLAGTIFKYNFNGTLRSLGEMNMNIPYGVRYKQISKKKYHKVRLSGIPTIPNKTETIELYKKQRRFRIFN